MPRLSVLATAPLICKISFRARFVGQNPRQPYNLAPEVKSAELQGWSSSRLLNICSKHIDMALQSAITALTQVHHDARMHVAGFCRSRSHLPHTCCQVYVSSSILITGLYETSRQAHSVFRLIKCRAAPAVCVKKQAVLGAVHCNAWRDVQQSDVAE